LKEGGKDGFFHPLPRNKEFSPKGGKESRGVLADKRKKRGGGKIKGRHEKEVKRVSLYH